MELGRDERPLRDRATPNALSAPRSVLFRVALTLGTVLQAALLYGLVVGLYVAAQGRPGLQQGSGVAVVGWGGALVFGLLVFFSLKKRLRIVAFSWVTVAVFAAAEALYVVLCLFAFLGAFWILFMLGIIEK